MGNEYCPVCGSEWEDNSDQCPVCGMKKIPVPDYDDPDADKDSMPYFYDLDELYEAFKSGSFKTRMVKKTVKRSPVSGRQPLDSMIDADRMRDDLTTDRDDEPEKFFNEIRGLSPSSKDDFNKYFEVYCKHASSSDLEEIE